MKVLFIVPSLKNTGPVIVVKDLVCLLLKHGHRCKVCYLDEIKELSFDCVTEKIRMSQKIDFDNYDIVHTHGYRPQLYVFLYKRLQSKTKFVTTMHNYLFSDFRYTYGSTKGLIYGLLYLLVDLRADRIVALSKDGQCYYSKLLFFKKITYAYNTRVCDFSQKLSLEEEQELMAFRGDSTQLVGASCVLSPLKGLDLIIQALQELPQVKFCIVGGGSLKDKLQKMAKNLGVDNRVLWVGSKSVAYRYLPYWDAYVMPSRSEGFGLSMLEAVIYGVPVVASNLPIFKELFTDDEISMFDLKDKKSVSCAMKRVFQEKQELSHRAKLKYEAEYSPNSFFQRYLDIYNSLLTE